MVMTLGKDVLENIKKDASYDFLKTNEHLGDNIILLGLGGSHAYGMNKEGSDMDVRGVALNTKREILLGRDFEQVVDVETDTTIYSFKKIISLLLECNPNTLEILGLRPEQYLIVKPEGQLLIDNASAFLSKRAVNSFGGYANQQLRRLENKVDRTLSQPQHIQHVLNTLEHARYDFDRKYTHYDSDIMSLYLEDVDGEVDTKQIMADFTLKGYPLEEFNSLWSELKNIVSAYEKIGKRNKKAIQKDKLGKHMAHLVRLYYMCFDIMQDGVIRTYREDEHQLLMDMRNNKFLDDEFKPIPEFYVLVDELEAKMQELKKTTKLPDEPDYDTVNKLLEKVNESIITGDKSILFK